MDVYLDIDKRYQNDELEGIITGYHALDKATDGLKKKNLIYLAGRPPMGKTALAINIAEKNVLAGNSVAIFSLEMGKEELVKRLILGANYINSQKIKNKELTADEWGRMLKGANALLDKKLFIEDNTSLTVAEMTSMCRRIKRDKGLDLVIIDCLQLISSNNSKLSRREEIDSISKSLKAMAKELDVPVIVISSLSRATEQRQNKRQVLSDLRESGQIEYDADLVMFVHREEYYNPTEENKGEAKIIIAKQRNGQLGIVKLKWLGQYTKFVDASHIKKRG
ncbi:DnaB-like helicase C-terminal domain-containing protein [Tissierella sp. P1]|uniref:replicative DNA helicase n=1 Tax=Tissierella sp. P1 TaxID=1280483 RepID=UPI001303ABC3|nr:DnaB-like helicase C-terminal domain-containing protein [Tissierella sp. P1]